MDPNLLNETLDYDEGSVSLELQFDENKYPFLMSITSLLYDFELMHDLAVILTYPEYEDFKFSRVFWYRNGRYINPYHKLRAASIKKQSPLLIEIIIAAVGGLWALIQIIDKISTWRHNKEKAHLELEKLRNENRLKDIELFQKEMELPRLLERRNATDILQRLVGRMERSDLKLLDIRVRIIRSENDRKEE